ncbi:uncharacterized protein LTR77_008454 [Saxophila tyrrhenica]|uniref:Uncharacterized protein n=1 Tax=Saxophila tyrrhenica TaxID=1690608 RepID=A0AAV9P1J5_9PEZI|nr:hypothetical protein LTR77_008454 [Saxophila tyrrhenica]
MAYLFYTLTFLFLLTSTSKHTLCHQLFPRTDTSTLPVLYLTRNIWKPHAPPIPYLTAPGTIPAPLYRIHDTISDYLDSYRYSRVPTSATFAEDAEAGFHSSNFNIAENIEAGDSRRGLDDRGKREVERIMRKRGVGFDEARRVWVSERFRREGVGEDGRPLDRKAVMFS